MKDFSNFKNSQGVAKFFGSLMVARQEAHRLHLSSRSYSEHMALGTFYGSLVELADELIETYQGQYGLVDLEIGSEKYKTAQSFLEATGAIFLSAHQLFSEKDTHLHNVLDEIVGLTYQTLYKVKFLK